MPPAVPKTRKLSSFCERPDLSQKCNRCTKYKHDCDPGRLSNRAQRSQRQPVHQRVSPSDRTTAVPGATQREILAAYQHLGSSHETPDLYIKASPSSRTSRSASSSGQSSSLATPDTQEFLQYFPDAGSHHDFQDSSDFLPYTSKPQLLDESSASSGHDAALEWEGVSPGDLNDAQAVHQHPDDKDVWELALASYRTRTQAAVVSDTNVQMLSGLPDFRPSRYCSSLFEERLDNRINRLWGNYKTFAVASSKGFGVTPLFGRTLSELFRMSRQMAESDDLVRDVRYACGAADACMNRKLPESTRAHYLQAYNHYDSQANIKFKAAVKDFADKIAQDESPDVLPLYTATFLYYAAGACMRGSVDLVKAQFAFFYFDQFTAWFPIRIRVSSTTDGAWATDMLLANNDTDPGMRISSLMFALGWARLEFDREEGLC
ncbi:hypothetical protein ST47_g6867 [Ascochyta rabiei]|uniref:Uncharacterized protein n=1 Tax=Didymella rabiei TaxID=5454 RepID=A0A163BTS6_DIDRA|nr:hypothetical protein ST47_g6867 [Ascochyta rabiei]